MKKISFIPMNLQLFAEDSGGGGGVAAPSEPTSAEPISTDPVGEPNSGVADPTQGTDPANQKAVQTPEQNAAFADLRRKAEAAERRAAEVESQRNRDREIARKYGKEFDVYSDADIAEKFGKSHGITNVEQLEQALQAEEYRKQGVDPDIINKLVEDHPAIQAAKAQQGKAAIDADLKELSDEYPDLKIKTVQDMMKLPNFEAIKEKALKGFSLLEAYEAVNRVEIRKKASEAAKQKALNDINGKSHLRTEGDGGGDPSDTHIDSETLSMYMDMGMSKADAQKYHKKLYG